MPLRPHLLTLFSALLLASCGENDPARDADVRTDTTRARTDSFDSCTAAQCDASPPSIPVLTARGGAGDVTTYGGVGNSTPSEGGACNYGSTKITHYAAIQVNELPGDLRGQWNGGRICGQCVEIRARTPTGWKTTHARIVDKCPDDHCGIDLGGAPATELMGAQAGRYAGEWTFVPCTGLAGVSDDSAALHVKVGSNAYWSLVQVRNPPSAVDSILLRTSGGAWISLPWATEAENFFKVPQDVLKNEAIYQLRVVYRMSESDTMEVLGVDLGYSGVTLPF